MKTILNIKILMILLFCTHSYCADEIVWKFIGIADIIQDEQGNFTTYFKDSVEVIVKDKTITSESAYYNEIQNITYFYDKVHIKQPFRDIYADTLHYKNSTKEIHLFRNVQFFDKKEKLEIFADSLHYFYQQKFGKAFKNVRVNYDSLTIKCDSVYVYSEPDSIIFWNNVSFTQQNFLARTEKAVFSKNNSILRLVEKPGLEQNKNFISGKNITIKYTEQTIDSIIVENFAKSRIVQVDTATNDTTITYLSGKIINIDVEKDNLKHISILENASIEHLYTDSKQSEDGAMNVIGYNIFIQFQEGEFKEMKIFKGIDGNFQRTQYQKDLEKEQ